MSPQNPRPAAPTSVRLPADLAEQLRARAAAEERSINQVIVRILREHLAGQTGGK